MQLNLVQELSNGEIASVNFSVISDEDQAAFEQCTDGLNENDRALYRGGKMWYFKSVASINRNGLVTKHDIDILRCKNSGHIIDQSENCTLADDLSRLLTKDHAKRKILEAFDYTDADATLLDGLFESTIQLD